MFELPERTRRPLDPVVTAPPAPLPFVVESLREFDGGHALDLACGRGRNLPALVAAGFQTTGVDRDPERLAAAAELCPSAAFVQRDLEADGLGPALQGPWDLIVTTYFLWRPLIAEMAVTLAPGGRWLLQTFHVQSHVLQGHPRRRALCLEPGEAACLASAAGLRVEHLFEGKRGDQWVVQLAAAAPLPIDKIGG